MFSSLIASSLIREITSFTTCPISYGHVGFAHIFLRRCYYALDFDPTELKILYPLTNMQHLCFQKLLFENTFAFLLLVLIIYYPVGHVAWPWASFLSLLSVTWHISETCSVSSRTASSGEYTAPLWSLTSLVVVSYCTSSLHLTKVAFGFCLSILVWDFNILDA